MIKHLVYKNKVYIPGVNNEKEDKYFALSNLRVENLTTNKIVLLSKETFNNVKASGGLTGSLRTLDYFDGSTEAKTLATKADIAFKEGVTTDFHIDSLDNLTLAELKKWVEAKKGFSINIFLPDNTKHEISKVIKGVEGTKAINGKVETIFEIKVARQEFKETADKNILSFDWVQTDYIFVLDSTTNTYTYNSIESIPFKEGDDSHLALKDLTNVTMPHAVEDQILIISKDGNLRPIPQPFSIYRAKDYPLTLNFDEIEKYNASFNYSGTTDLKLEQLHYTNDRKFDIFIFFEKEMQIRYKKGDLEGSGKILEIIGSKSGNNNIFTITILDVNKDGVDFKPALHTFTITDNNTTGVTTIEDPITTILKNPIRERVLDLNEIVDNKIVPNFDSVTKKINYFQMTDGEKIYLPEGSIFKFKYSIDVGGVKTDGFRIGHLVYKVVDTSTSTHLYKFTLNFFENNNYYRYDFTITNNGVNAWTIVKKTDNSIANLDDIAQNKIREQQNRANIVILQNASSDNYSNVLDIRRILSQKIVPTQLGDGSIEFIIDGKKVILNRGLVLIIKFHQTFQGITVTNTISGTINSHLKNGNVYSFEILSSNSNIGNLTTTLYDFTITNNGVNAWTNTYTSIEIFKSEDVKTNTENIKDNTKEIKKSENHVKDILTKQGFEHSAKYIHTDLKKIGITDKQIKELWDDDKSQSNAGYGLLNEIVKTDRNDYDNIKVNVFNNASPPVKIDYNLNHTLILQGNLSDTNNYFFGTYLKELIASTTNTDFNNIEDYGNTADVLVKFDIRTTSQGNLMDVNIWTKRTTDDEYANSNHWIVYYRDGGSGVGWEAPISAPNNDTHKLETRQINEVAKETYYFDDSKMMIKSQFDNVVRTKHEHDKLEFEYHNAQNEFRIGQHYVIWNTRNATNATNCTYDVATKETWTKAIGLGNNEETVGLTTDFVNKTVTLVAGIYEIHYEQYFYDVDQSGALPQTRLHFTGTKNVDYILRPTKKLHSGLFMSTNGSSLTLITKCKMKVLNTITVIPQYWYGKTVSRSSTFCHLQTNLEEAIQSQFTCVKIDSGTERGG